MIELKVALYSGRGGELAPDVSEVLNELSIRHDFINEREIRSGILRDYGTLIVPGGYTRRIIPALGDVGKRQIHESVKNGCGYIGICAGAYVAPELGLTKAKVIRGSGTFITTVEIVGMSHPVTDGYKGRLAVFYQNGPRIGPSSEDTPLAFYRDGSAAIIVSRCGGGKVVLFSPHPEKLPDTWGLLENAINYVKAEAPDPRLSHLYMRLRES